MIGSEGKTGTEKWKKNCMLSQWKHDFLRLVIPSKSDDELYRKKIWNLMAARRNWRGGNCSWGKWKCENSAHPIFRHTNKKADMNEMEMNEKSPQSCYPSSEGEGGCGRMENRRYFMNLLRKLWFLCSTILNLEQLSLKLPPPLSLSLSKTHEWTIKICCVSHRLFLK